MSITVPTDVPALTTGDYTTGEDIEGPDWRTLLHHANWLYAHGGGRTSGVIWPQPWETVSTTYTTDGAWVLRRDLDRWRGGIDLQRAAAASDYLTVLRVYGRDVDVQLELIEVTGASDISLAGPTSVSLGSTAQWATIALTVSAEAEIECHLRAKAPSSEVTAALWQLQAWEAVLTPSDMPTS